MTQISFFARCIKADTGEKNVQLKYIAVNILAVSGEYEMHITSAFGPMKRSPSRAPAITRTCLGRPTL